MDNSSSLTFLLTVPLAAIVLSCLVPKALQRIYSIFSALVILALTLYQAFPLITAPSIELANHLVDEQKLSWVSELGLYLTLRLDSVSVWFVLLNAVTGVIAFSLRGSWYRKNPRLFTGLGFFLWFALNAAFLSTNLVVFYLAYEAVFIPMILMVGVWGEHQKAKAVFRFFLMSFFGSILMLISIFYLSFISYQQTGQYSNELSDLVRAAEHANSDQLRLIFWGFFLAFAIKVPLVPFHAWLRDVYTYSPMPGTIWMSGILSKLGVFGFIRFVLPIFGKTCEQYQGMMMTLAAISVVYPAILAIRSNQPKTLLAYSSISHLGFVMLGVFTLKPAGASAAILLAAGHTLVSSLLFALYHHAEERNENLNLDQYFGTASKHPILFTALFVVVLASVSLPGTMNFSGEFLVLLSAYPVSALCTIISGVGVILGAVYMLKFFQRLGLGPIESKVSGVVTKDLLGFDLSLVVVLVGLVIYLGFHPVFFLKGN